MIPRAQVVHAIRGRARLRVAEKRRDRRWFATVARGLAGLPGVRGVEARPLTSSLLIDYDGELDEVIDRAHGAGWFEVAETFTGSPPALARIHGEIARLDRALSSKSNGTWDLTTTAFFLLLGASGYQLYRGDFLPKGGALFINALGMLYGAAERHRRTATRMQLD